MSFMSGRYFVRYLKLPERYTNIIYRGFNDKFDVKPELIQFCEKTFDLPTYRIQSIMLQYPSLQKVEENQIESILNMLILYGISKGDVTERPKVLNIHPLTTENRLKILTECGVLDINLNTLSKYLTITRKKSIQQLQREGIILQSDDIWKRLVRCFDDWPEVQAKMVPDEPLDINKTLREFQEDCVRLEVLFKFLHLYLDISEAQFAEILKTYLAIKHKSLSSISQMIHLAKHTLNFPKEKIVSHGFLFQVDPENILKIINDVKEFAEVDVKKVLLKHPVILKKSCKSIQRIKEILKEEEVSLEAQRRCFLIYVLSPETILERIKEFKNMNKLKSLVNNPRFLQLIYYKTKVVSRLNALESNNKKCSSIHKLVSGTKEFDRYVNQFGDFTRGSDILGVLYRLCEEVDYSREILHSSLLKHRFWLHTSLVAVIDVLDYLRINFSVQEIFDNCQLLIYPLTDVKKYVELILMHKKSTVTTCQKEMGLSSNGLELEFINSTLLTSRQILSLSLYLLEKDYDFSGDGIWDKYVVDLNTTPIPIPCKS